jgi:PIN domain nuclease of toxin-antitoxin system
VRVLLDTHIVLGLLRQNLLEKYPAIAIHLTKPTTLGFVSVASIWEIALKTRLRKLDLGMPIEDIAGYLEAVGLTLLPIETSHVVDAANPLPHTKDPFDCLLIAQCQIENLSLVTVDHALVDHPVAWKP